MKKIVTLLLVGVICLSFVACGNKGNNNNENKDFKLVDKNTQVIIGTWKSTSMYPLTFNDDKTGTFYYQGKNYDFTWTYNEELKCYVVASSGLYATSNFLLKNENGVTYLECSDAKLYRESDFEGVLQKYIEKRQIDLENHFFLGNLTKIEFGKQYNSGNCSITFTELLVENDELNLYVKVTNNGFTTISSNSDIPLNIGYCVLYYSPVFEGGGMGSTCELSFTNEQKEIKPGETLTIKTTISKTKVKDAIYSFGTIVGRASCNLDDEVGDYYINLEECKVK